MVNGHMTRSATLLTTFICSDTYCGATPADTEAEKKHGGGGLLLPATIKKIKNT